MIIGEKITELRKKNDLTQDKLAEKVNVTRQTISNWESNITSPDINQALKLSKIFNISISDLLDEKLEIQCKKNNSILQNLIGKECYLDIEEDDYRIGVSTICKVIDVNHNFLKFQFYYGKKTITKLVDMNLVHSFRVIKKKEVK